MVISEEMALKYFGDVNPLGQIISIDDKHNYAITGVMENMPKNSYFHFDFLVSWSSLLSIQGQERMDSWHRYRYLTFLELAEDTNISEFEQKVRSLFNEHKAGFITGCQIQNLKEIHFHDKVLF